MRRLSISIKDKHNLYRILLSYIYFFNRITVLSRKSSSDYFINKELSKKESVSNSSLDLEFFLLICEKTQYIFFYTGIKKKTFSRLAKIKDYVESYLRKELEETVAYRYLIYKAIGLVLKTVN